MMKKWIVILFVLLSVSVSNAVEADEKRDLQDIRERSIRVETKLEDIDKRLIRVETKLENIDKRFELMDKRFELIDKRFELMDKRFERLENIMMWGFGIMFTGMWALIGFVLWDRRTALAPAVRRTKELEEREEVLEKWRKMVDTALKELAGGDAKVAGVLKHAGLL